MGTWMALILPLQHKARESGEGRSDTGAEGLPADWGRMGNRISLYLYSPL